MKSTYWGGGWSLHGETYNISNGIFPRSPFADARQRPESRKRSNWSLQSRIIFPAVSDRDTESLEKRGDAAKNSAHTSPSRDGKQPCSNCAACNLKPTKPLPLPANLGDIPENYFNDDDAKLPGPAPSSSAKKPTNAPLIRPDTKPQGRSSIRKRMEQQANCGIRFQLRPPPSNEAASANPAVSKWWSTGVFMNNGVCIYELKNTAHRDPQVNYEGQ